MFCPHSDELRDRKVKKIFWIIFTHSGDGGGGSPANGSGTTDQSPTAMSNQMREGKGVMGGVVIYELCAIVSVKVSVSVSVRMRVWM